MSKRKSPRENATQEVLDAGRALGAAAVLFHAVVAEKQGISAIEEKAIDLILRHGPLTAGELGAKSGLAPPSITGLLNRLEKKGFVRREGHPEDGRKIRVQVVEERLQSFAPLFQDLVAGMESLCESFSVDELRLIARFMESAARSQHAATTKLSGEP